MASRRLRGPCSLLLSQGGERMYFVILAGLVLGAFSYEAGGPHAEFAFMGLATAAMTLLPACLGAVFMLYCGVKTRRATGDTASLVLDRLAVSYSHTTRVIDAVALGAYALSLFTFGWSGVPEMLGVAAWELPSRAIVALPFLLSLVLSWIPLHYAQNHLRRTGPTLLQQLSFNMRQYVLTLVVPIGIILGLLDTLNLLPDSVSAAFKNGFVREGAFGVIVLTGYVLSPAVLVRLWKTRPLPACPLRDRLTALCDRIGVRFRDIRIWETPGLFFLNAAVMGVTGRMRYILVSRTLLDVMSAEQVEAVFAHELGHAKRRHMLYYLVLAADFILLATLFDTLTGGVSLWPPFVYAAVSVASFALYWGLGFGYVSRTFERDADLFGGEAVGSCDLFASALETIAHMNGVRPEARSWRHGSIRSRVLFLHAAASDSEVKKAFLARREFVETFLVSLALVSAVANAVLALLM